MEDQNKYNGSRYNQNDGSRQDAYTQQQYGGYAQQYTADPRYTQQYPDPRYVAGQTGRIRMPREGQSYASSGRTERIRMPREGYEQQNYASSGRTERIRMPREGYEQQGYTPSGRTERIRMPREGYEQGATERIRMPREGYEQGATERIRMPRERRERDYDRDYERDYDREEQRERAYARGGETERIRARRYEEEDQDIEELFHENYDEEELFEDGGDDGERSAFARRIDAIRQAISEIPARTLLFIGGGIAVVLIAIILLVLFLPGNKDEGPASVAASPTPEWTATPVPTRVPTPTPAPTPHPLETPLQFGMEADIVADIQLRLIELGYMDYPVVDGVEQVTTVYGRTTKGAIQTFQEKNGLDSDGWCGIGTYDLLMSDTCKAYFISRNDEGDMVLKMQNRLIQLGYLKAAATGYCGESTVLAVQKFQQKNGLDPDGKAGQQTLTLLYSDDALDVNGAKMAMDGTVTAVASTPAPETTADATADTTADATEDSTTPAA